LLQVDGYAGFAGLVTDPVGNAPQLAFCWADARRKVYDVFVTTKSQIAVNPDQITYDYLRDREHAPRGTAWYRALIEWDRVRSNADAVYDDVVVLRGEDIRPMATWGVSPDQSVPVDGCVPELARVADHDRGTTKEVLDFMGLGSGAAVQGTRIDVAFLGSCTNGRVSDFEAVAEQLRGRGFSVAGHVRALAVPGSRRVREALIAKGIDRVLIDAGFEFRDAGCSLCCGMNADSLRGQQTWPRLQIATFAGARAPRRAVPS
jgi:3-isopropylmalate/(R)-2-methylmalate dehydratase large subunit